MAEELSAADAAANLRRDMRNSYYRDDLLTCHRNKRKWLKYPNSHILHSPIFIKAWETYHDQYETCYAGYHAELSRSKAANTDAGMAQQKALLAQINAAFRYLAVIYEEVERYHAQILHYAPPSALG